MNKTKILEVVGHVLSYLPQKLLRSLEIVAQVAQGKGGGGDSVLREVRTIVKLAHKLGLDELNVVDCGANVGTWSIALARSFPKATIIAFEPSKFAFDILKINTRGIPSISIENLKGFSEVRRRQVPPLNIKSSPFTFNCSKSESA